MCLSRGSQGRNAAFFFFLGRKGHDCRIFPFPPVDKVAAQPTGEPAQLTGRLLDYLADALARHAHKRGDVRKGHFVDALKHEDRALARRKPAEQRADVVGVIHVLQVRVSGVEPAENMGHGVQGVADQALALADAGQKLLAPARSVPRA